MTRPQGIARRHWLLGMPYGFVTFDEWVADAQVYKEANGRKERWAERVFQFFWDLFDAKPAWVTNTYLHTYMRSSSFVRYVSF